MGKQTFFEKVREWLGGVGFDIFLWSIRMTQEQYLDAVVRESGLTQRAADGDNWWSCDCGVANHPDWKSCQFCGYPRR